MNFLGLPPLNSLKAFAAVAEAGSFSAAADMLNVTHAAVSQQVRSLEAYLGAALVIRQGKTVALTPDGLVLARDISDGFQRLITGVEAFTQVDAERPLHVTMTPSFAVSWLMPRISDFKHQHPEIELMLNPSVGVTDLAAGQIDLAIRFGRGGWDDVRAELLFQTDFVIVASRDLIGSANITNPEQLLAYPWLQEIGSHEVSNWLETQGVIATERLNVTHMPGYMVLDGVRRGDGICATAKLFVESDIEAGRLVVLFETERDATGYHLVTRKGSMRPNLKTFVRWLKTVK